MIVPLEMKLGYTRIPSRAIPSGIVECDITSCVYNENKLCNNPRCNKGNSDSTCHKMSVKVLLINHLTRIEK